MARIKCKVLQTFVEYVAEEGMIVGNMGETAEVPEHKVDDFVERGLIAPRKGKSASADDGDGKSGGSGKSPSSGEGAAPV